MSPLISSDEASKISFKKAQNHFTNVSEMLCDDSSVICKKFSYFCFLGYKHSSYTIYPKSLKIKLKDL